MRKGIVGFDLGVPAGSFIPSGAHAAVWAQEEGAVFARAFPGRAGAGVLSSSVSHAGSPRAEALAVALQLLLLQASVLCLSQQ